MPQGSVLGPLLYSIYVYNLHRANLSAQYFSFADDTVLVYTGTSERTLNSDINADLKSYLNWLYSNKLKINIDKTKYIVFKQKNKDVFNMDLKIKDTLLQQVSEIKYLGLIVDEKLGWYEHINHIKEKIVPMIPVLFKCRNYLTKKTKNNVYNAFFLSNLRYLLPVWGTCSKTNFNSMKTLQNKILKILYEYDRLTPSEILYRELSVVGLDGLLGLEQCKLIHKILNKKQKSNVNIILHNEVHDYGTRARNNIYPTSARTNVGLKNPIVNASSTYNRLPVNLKSIKNHNTYLRECKKYFCLNS